MDTSADVMKNTRKALRLAAAFAAIAGCALLLAVSLSFSTVTEVGMDREHPMEVHSVEQVMLQTGIGIKTVIQCGDDEVTLCTVCGTAYDLTPISGETFAECLARHRAMAAQIIEDCE